MKRLIMLVLLASGTAGAAPQNTAEPQTIVVTGTRLSEAEKQLWECLARRCPPLEDMAASLKYAEGLFVNGDYRKARQIVQGSVGRNDKHAAQHPHAVAALYRADARLSIHLGDGQTYRSSTYGAVRSLKKGLPREDLAHLRAQFDVASMLLSLGKRDEAQSVYKDIARRGERAGATDLAALAELKSAWIDHGGRDKVKGRAVIDGLAASADPALKSVRLGALILLARIDREEGKTGASDRLMAALSEAGLEKPTLLWAPPVDLDQRWDGRVQNPNKANYGSQLLDVSGENFTKKFVDIGFWVKPDGSVEDAEVIRSVGSTDWIKPVLSSVSKRIYSPTRSPSGSYRVERYTRTSLKFIPTGTRLERHSSRPRIEYVDLTEEKPGPREAQ